MEGDPFGDGPTLPEEDEEDRDALSALLGVDNRWELDLLLDDRLYDQQELLSDEQWAYVGEQLDAEEKRLLEPPPSGDIDSVLDEGSLPPSVQTSVSNESSNTTRKRKAPSSIWQRVLEREAKNPHLREQRLKRQKGYRGGLHGGNLREKASTNAGILDRYTDPDAPASYPPDQGGDPFEPPAEKRRRLEALEPPVPVAPDVDPSMLVAKYPVKTRADMDAMYPWSRWEESSSSAARRVASSWSYGRMDNPRGIDMGGDTYEMCTASILSSTNGYYYLNSRTAISKQQYDHLLSTGRCGPLRVILTNYFPGYQHRIAILGTRSLADTTTRMLESAARMFPFPPVGESFVRKWAVFFVDLGKRGTL